jgi:hypothetical protein
MVNTSQQVGGSIGTALLSTIFASAASSYATAHHGAAQLAGAASIHGYTSAFYVAAGMFAVGFVVALLVLPRKIQPATAQAGPSPQPATEAA